MYLRKYGIILSPVTVGSFDLTTRHDLIMHFMGLSIDWSIGSSYVRLVTEDMFSWQ